MCVHSKCLMRPPKVKPKEIGTQEWKSPLGRCGAVTAGLSKPIHEPSPSRSWHKIFWLP